MARRLSSVCVCVCVSVCKRFCGNRYYDAKNNSIATKLAHDGQPLDLHPGCAQGRGQRQRSRDTSAFVPITKIASSRRQMAGLRPNLHTMVSRSARVQDVFKVKVKVKGHVLGAVLCWHEKRFSSEGNGRIATKLAHDGLQGAYSRKIVNSCHTCDDRKPHLRRRELFTKQITRATIAKLVANDSKICNIPLVVARACFTSQIRVYKLTSSSFSRLQSLLLQIIARYLLFTSKFI